MDERCRRWEELGHIPVSEMKEYLSGSFNQERAMSEIFYRCPDLINLSHFSVIDGFAANSEINHNLFRHICRYSRIDILLHVLDKINLNLVIKKIFKHGFLCDIKDLFVNDEVVNILFMNGMILTYEIYKLISGAPLEIQKNFIKNMLKMNYSIEGILKICVSHELIFWVVENYFQKFTLNEKIANDALIIILEKRSVTMNFVEKIIAIGANLQIQGDEFFIKSCERCQKDVVLFFLGYSNINIFNGKALWVAMMFENDQIVELLLEMGIIITENSIKSITYKNKYIRLLVKHGIDANLVAKKLFKKNISIFGFLVENGADLNQIVLLKN